LRTTDFEPLFDSRNVSHVNHFQSSINQTHAFSSDAGGWPTAHTLQSVLERQVWFKRGIGLLNITEKELPIFRRSLLAPGGALTLRLAHFKTILDCLSLVTQRCSLPSIMDSWRARGEPLVCVPQVQFGSIRHFGLRFRSSMIKSIRRRPRDGR